MKCLTCDGLISNSGPSQCSNCLARSTIQNVEELKTEEIVTEEELMDEELDLEEELMDEELDFEEEIEDEELDLEEELMDEELDLEEEIEDEELDLEEEIEDDENEEKPDNSWTRKELIQYLESKKVNFDKRETKAKLLELAVSGIFD